MNVDTVKLRQFIQEHFSAEELRTLLLDYFRPVWEDLTATMPKRQQVQMLLEYCIRQGKFPDLLAAIQRERSFFQPDDYLLGQKAPTAAPPAPTPITRNPRQIFISHAHQDAEVAPRLARDLAAHGYDIWIAPDSIRPGEKWVEAINRGLEESGIFVLLLSPDAVASRWVQMETNVAISYTHDDEMQLYPLMLKACRLPALWRAFQRISLRGSYERGIESLLLALEPEEPLSSTSGSIGLVGNLSLRVFRNSPPPLGTSENKMVWQRTGQEMVKIPAGEFLYGDKKEKIYLDEFWIAKTPVTNAEYALFVAEMKVKPPKHWNGCSLPAELADHPVVYVSWDDAKAYTEWAGLELPTEEQWEKAARGTDGREYPWGNDWRDNHCNTSEAGFKITTPVGQFSPQGDSPYGCVDMSGNVSEWTSPIPKEGIVWPQYSLQGGSWSHAQFYAKVATRNAYAAADYRNYSIGFRVVLVSRPLYHPYR